MILLQTMDMVLQGIDTGCCEITRLPHATAKHLAYTPGFPDKFLRAQHEAANRTTKAFAQANGNAVKKLSVDLRVLLPGHQGIKKPGAVQVKDQAVFIANLPRGDAVTLVNSTKPSF